MKKCKIVLLARWTRIKHKFYSKLTSKYSVSHVSDFYSSRQRKKFEKKTKKVQRIRSIRKVRPETMTMERVKQDKVVRENKQPRELIRLVSTCDFMKKQIF